MFYTNTVSPRLLAVLNKLKLLNENYKFRLVGGTSLALQAGHRESVDIDLFSEQSFNLQNLEFDLRNIFPQLQFVSRSRNGFSTILEEIKCDFYDWRTKFIRPPLKFGGIFLASIEDIAAFKLDAICRRTETKDFFDIAVILEKFTLKDLLGFYNEKYPFQDIRIILDSLPKVHKLEGKVSYKIFSSMTLELVNEKIQNEIDNFFKEQLQLKLKKQEERLKNAESLLSKKKK